MGQPFLHDHRRILRRNHLALEFDGAAAGIDDPGDGFKDGGLACAVGAQHGGDFALCDLQAHAPDGANRPIGAFDVGELQKGLRAHQAPFRTKGSARRRKDMSSAEPR